RRENPSSRDEDRVHGGPGPGLRGPPARAEAVGGAPAGEPRSQSEQLLAYWSSKGNPTCLVSPSSPCSCSERSPSAGGAWSTIVARGPPDFAASPAGRGSAA